LLCCKVAVSFWWLHIYSNKNVASFISLLVEKILCFALCNDLDKFDSLY